MKFFTIFNKIPIIAAIEQGNSDILKLFVLQKDFDINYVRIANINLNNIYISYIIIMFVNIFFMKFYIIIFHFIIIYYIK